MREINCYYRKVHYDWSRNVTRCSGLMLLYRKQSVVKYCMVNGDHVKDRKLTTWSLGIG